VNEHPPRETTQWSRRAAMAALPALALTAAACSSREPRSVDDVRHDAGPPPKAATPDEAIDVLMKGNARFASHRPQIRDTADIEVLWTEIVNGQQPFAMVLGCADSRLAPELIFDQFVGDIFVVREAGNIAVSPTNLGSLEYGHAVLKARALLVLGHSSCGAVKAAYENDAPGANIQAIVDAIKPGIAGARDESDAIARNVGAAIAHVRSASPLLNDAEKSGAFKIVGAVYDIRAATVRLL
jgi:carbonic anhydrase